MLDLLSNALLQGMTYGIAALGLVIAFRIIRYPDLTADGSFMLGSMTFAVAATSTGTWPLAVLLSLIAGAAAGLLTSLLNTVCGVSRLLTGILTTMIAYSVAYRISGGRPNVGLSDKVTMFSPPAGLGLDPDTFRLAVAPLIAILVAVAVWRLLKSELGLLLRSTGGNPVLVEELNRSPATYRSVGLVGANSLIALSGALVSAQQGFADVNMGLGVIITLVAAVVIGEELLRRLSKRLSLSLAHRAVVPFAGATAYFALYLLILRASIRGWIWVRVEPTDLKMLSALLIVSIVALRRVDSRREEILPL